MSKVRRVALSGFCAAAIALAMAAPASAWGGPTNFAGGACNAYSNAKTAHGQAGAHTMRNTGSGTLQVAFRGSGHANINPVSGTSTVVRSSIEQSIVDVCSVAGGTHSCGSAGSYSS